MTRSELIATALLLASGLGACSPALAEERPPPAAAEAVEPQALMQEQMEGEWVGTFRRFDAEGNLQAELPSRIIVRFPQDDERGQYHQTNILTLPSGDEQRIDSFGRWDGNVLRFTNERLEGSYFLLPEDPTGRSSVLLMRFTDGSGLEISEIITLSIDGTRRHRVAQFFRNGELIRRTLVDEVRAD
ncbi:MAG: DUF3598 family protein [Erythrobacter sp.]